MKNHLLMIIDSDKSTDGDVSKLMRVVSEAAPVLALGRVSA
jgi:hypothetical protein